MLLSGGSGDGEMEENRVVVVVGGIELGHLEGLQPAWWSPRKARTRGFGEPRMVVVQLPPCNHFPYTRSQSNG